MAEPTRSQANAMRIAAAIGAAVLVAFWVLRVAAPGILSTFDHAELMWPTYHWTADQIRSGEFPLWNPNALTGRPTLATLQAGMLHPLHLLYVVLPVTVVMAFSTCVHLLLGFAAAFWFARTIGLAAAPCLMAAMLFAMRGSLPGATANLAILEASAWLAPGFLAALEIARGRPGRGGLGVALCVSLSLFAGFPQMTLYAVYAWSFFALGILVLDRVPAAGVGRSIGAIGLAVSLGAGIAAVQLLPALELAGEGIRARGTLPLEQMFPFGLVGYETVIGGLSRALSSQSTLPILTWSFGVVGLALVPLALFNRPARNVVVVLSVLGLATLGVAAGPASAIFELHLWLPELGNFRIPSRVLAVTDFCFAMLAAAGLDQAVRWTRGSLTPSDNSRGGVRSRATLAGVVGVIAVTAAGAEIFAAPITSHTNANRIRAAKWPHVVGARPVLDALRGDPQRTWVWERSSPERLPWRGLSAIGIRSLSDYDALFTRRQSQYMSFLMWGELERIDNSGSRRIRKPFYGRTRVLGPDVEPAKVLARRRLVEIAGGSHVLIERALVTRAPFSTVIQTAGMTARPIEDPHFSLYTLHDALPRAYTTHSVKRAPELAALLSAMSQPEFDPRVSSFVEDEFDVSLAPRHTGIDQSDRVKIVRDENHFVELEAEMRSDGLVILADAFYPGWTAFVDGNPTRIWATNHLFRGVAVSEGTHRVVFRYRPASFMIGAVTSLACSVLWLALGFMEFRPGRSKNDPA